MSSVTTRPSAVNTASSRRLTTHNSAPPPLDKGCRKAFLAGVLVGTIISYVACLLS